ncbi:hypothetical protein V5799_028714 [Amblyomma americanum]|uniref:Uncharacterized protein n=1 Tax=Amblyomma americanum TaxID=6943 RepID=A0AAQ4DC30_AMBAM
MLVLEHTTLPRNSGGRETKINCFTKHRDMVFALAPTQNAHFGSCTPVCCTRCLNIWKKKHATTQVKREPYLVLLLSSAGSNAFLIQPAAEEYGNARREG